MQNILLLFAISLLCGLTACKPTAKTSSTKFNYLSNIKTAEEIMALENKLEKLHQIFIGHFSNKDQADTASISFLKVQQEMILVPIWKKRAGEYWFFMGWFQSGSYDRALAQGISQIKRINRDSFAIISYSLHDEEANNFYEEEWKKETPFANLNPRDLQLDCIHYLVEKENNVFEMVNKDNLCAKQMSDVIHHYAWLGFFSPQSLSFLTVFYDKNKQKLFEYPKPYGSLFKRIPKEKIDPNSFTSKENKTK